MAAGRGGLSKSRSAAWTPSGMSGQPPDARPIRPRRGAIRTTAASPDDVDHAAVAVEALADTTRRREAARIGVLHQAPERRAPVAEQGRLQSTRGGAGETLRRGEAAAGQDAEGGGERLAGVRHHGPAREPLAADDGGVGVRDVPLLPDEHDGRPLAPHRALHGARAAGEGERRQERRCLRCPHRPIIHGKGAQPETGAPPERRLSLPDLYIINLCLQERLERDWREEVRAVEAARWLDKAGLLRNYNNGLSLRRLLRAGRIAGQEQRPNRKNGTWFIRRLAASRDPHAVREARERLRRCLPIDRDVLPPDWPVNQGPAVFWQELGKTVAAFGYLEHILASTCFALLATGERATALLQENDHEAMRRWTKRLVHSQTDSLRRLTCQLEKVLTETGLVPRAVREDLVARLDELRAWRNALCHGAWLSVDKDGSARLEHVYRDERLPTGFERDVDVKRLSDVRGRTVDVTIRIAEAASVAGPAYTHMGGTGYALTTVMPRMYEPRSAPPEPDLLQAARRAAERDDARNREGLTRHLASLDAGGTAPTEPE